MQKKIQKELTIIAKKFEGSRVGLPLSLKVMTAETILNLMVRRKGFGLFVILGWQKKWQGFLDISDSQQDIFAKDQHNVIEEASGKHFNHDISATINFDGAILIDGQGMIIHSGVMIEGMRPRTVAERINPGRFRDLSEQFGFTTKVHTRHLTAIAASHAFKGTTVYTVSEENNALHIFEGGRILYHSRASFN